MFVKKVKGFTAGDGYRLKGTVKGLFNAKGFNFIVSKSKSVESKKVNGTTYWIAEATFKNPIPAHTLEYQVYDFERKRNFLKVVGIFQERKITPPITGDREWSSKKTVNLMLGKPIVPPNL